jgi:hypothetical protein
MRLDPGNQTEFMSLSNASDVVVDFAGAHLTFTKFVRFIALGNYVRITVRNLSVDLDPLPYTALHVRSIDTPTGSFVGDLAPNHPPIESLGQGDGKNLGEVMDGASTHTKRGLTETVVYQPNVTRLSATKYSVALTLLDKQKTAEPMGGITVGDVFVMGQRTGPGGFQVLGGEEVVMQDVTAYACASTCYCSAHAPKFSMLRGGIVLLHGRYKAANDGGHNHHSARYGAWVEGGDWQNTGDVSGFRFCLPPLPHQPQRSTRTAHAQHARICNAKSVLIDLFCHT